MKSVQGERGQQEEDRRNIFPPLIFLFWSEFQSKRSFSQFLFPLWVWAWLFTLHTLPSHLQSYEAKPEINKNSLKFGSILHLCG